MAPRKPCTRLVGDVKIAGSAQVRKDGVLLQHGSILLQFFPERMTELMRFADETEKAAMTAELSRRATDLSQAAGRQVGFAEVVEAVQGGIAEQCGLKLERGERTPSEIIILAELAQKKYSSAEWTLRS